MKEKKRRKKSVSQPTRRHQSNDDGKIILEVKRNARCSNNFNIALFL
jgi:hypothetical protein